MLRRAASASSPRYKLKSVIATFKTVLARLWTCETVIARYKTVIARLWTCKTVTARFKTGTALGEQANVFKMWG